MFWGGFSGLAKKGPCLIFEKDWGWIDTKVYCERVIPLVDGWMRLYPEHSFMQDNAPSHFSKERAAELRSRGIKTSH